MSYVDRVLQPGEHVVVRAALHWVVYKTGFTALFGAIIVGAASRHAPGLEWAILTVALALLVFALALLLRAWWQWWGTEIAVTDRRIIYKRGVIRRRTVEMNLEQIESVQVDQSILGRILGFGDITVHGTGEGIENIRQIAQPVTVRSAVTAR